MLSAYALILVYLCVNTDVCVHVCAENFDMTSNDEITLKGFYSLHAMTAADSEGGVGELRAILTAMGYDRQLRLRQVRPWRQEGCPCICECLCSYVHMYCVCLFHVFVCVVCVCVCACACMCVHVYACMCV